MKRAFVFLSAFPSPIIGIALSLLLLINITKVNGQTANTSLGVVAGTSITTGDYNVAIGDSTMYTNNVTGKGNVVVGFRAGYSISSGGDSSLPSGFIGPPPSTSTAYEGSNSNVMIGTNAGFYLTTGTKNIMIGQDAGVNNNSQRNIFMGARSGYMTTGADNIFIGVAAGHYTSSGGDNVFIGKYVAVNNTTGARNVYLGHESAFNSSTGSDNTFLGYNAGYNNGISNFNTFIGASNGLNNASGENNVGLGAQADFSAASSAFSKVVYIGASSVIGASDATAVGYQTTVTGSNSIAIGSTSSVSGTNAIAIGFGSSVTANNEVYLGNASTVSIGGSVNWTATSDGRYKTNVQDNVPGLSFINQLRPVTYQFDLEKLRQKDNPSGLSLPTEKGKTTYTGLIAQEVLEAAESVGFDFSGVKVPDNPKKELYGIRYAEMVVPLIKAVQELNQKISEREQQISAQEETIAKLEKMMVGMNARLERFEATEIGTVVETTAGVIARK